MGAGLSEEQGSLLKLKKYNKELHNNLFGSCKSSLQGTFFVVKLISIFAENEEIIRK